MLSLSDTINNNDLMSSLRYLQTHHRDLRHELFFSHQILEIFYYFFPVYIIW